MSPAYDEIYEIAINYLKGYFVFDVLATIPCLFSGENRDLYPFKVIRIVHFGRISDPIYLILGFVLSKYSKKRQQDLSGFVALLIFVVFIAHFMACIWLSLGFKEACYGSFLSQDINITYTTSDPQYEYCIKSWVYMNGFDTFNTVSQYIFAFYWIFEVMTTVGYGDYYGATTSE